MFHDVFVLLRHVSWCCIFRQCSTFAHNVMFQLLKAEKPWVNILSGGVRAFINIGNAFWIWWSMINSSFLHPQATCESSASKHLSPFKSSSTCKSEIWLGDFRACQVSFVAFRMVICGLSKHHWEEHRTEEMTGSHFAPYYEPGVWDSPGNIRLFRSSRGFEKAQASRNSGRVQSGMGLKQCGNFRHLQGYSTQHVLCGAVSDGNMDGSAVPRLSSRPRCRPSVAQGSMIFHGEKHVEAAIIGLDLGCPCCSVREHLRFREEAGSEHLPAPQRHQTHPFFANKTSLNIWFKMVLQVLQTYIIYIYILYIWLSITW